MDNVYSITQGQLEDIADAIRLKTGKSEKMTVAEMPNEISGISGGSENFSTSNVQAVSNGFVGSIIGIAEQVTE